MYDTLSIDQYKANYAAMLNNEPIPYGNVKGMVLKDSVKDSVDYDLLLRKNVPSDLIRKYFTFPIENDIGKENFTNENIKLAQSNTNINSNSNINNNSESNSNKNTNNSNTNNNNMNHFNISGVDGRTPKTSFKIYQDKRPSSVRFETNSVNSTATQNYEPDTNELNKSINEYNNYYSVDPNNLINSTHKLISNLPINSSNKDVKKLSVSIDQILKNYLELFQ
ncbi:unnamed protein product [[Candida] boidinii]|nr:unnamed protein product [[Candida] boidinii]